VHGGEAVEHDGYSPEDDGGCGADHAVASTGSAVGGGEEDGAEQDSE
jgi:hypothetical protein